MTGVQTCALPICVERLQAGVDEVDPAIDARQGVEDVAVEDEDAPDPPGRRQRVVKSGVVVSP